MKVYFSPWFSAYPYVQRKEGTIKFNEKITGPVGLLSLLQEKAGVHHEPVSAQQRSVLYCNNMKANIKEGDIFYNSFQLDPLGVSNRLLLWRDTLVAAGWDIKGSQSLVSPKLDFIRRIEPENLPMAECDMWLEILKLAQGGAFEGADLELKVATPKEMTPPFYNRLIDTLKHSGIKCRYTEDKDGIKVILAFFMHYGRFVPTLRTREFENEDEMLRYAVSNINDWDLVICEDRKRLDNMLKLMGLPTSGSDLGMSEPQILQLFKLGNSLFKYPCSYTSLLGWLNAPKSPLKGLGWWLARAVISSGGIYNEAWEEAKRNFNSKDEENDAEKIIEEFLPIPKSGEILVDEVVEFNRRLGKWAASMSKMVADVDEKAQYALLAESCRAMCEVLQDVGEVISQENMTQYMSRVSIKYRGTHCEAQTGCTTVISDPGDISGNIFKRVNKVLWLGLYDSQNHTYIYDFLTDREIKELMETGVMLYTREQDSSYLWYRQTLPIVMSGQIELAVPKKVNGSSVIEHPIMTYMKYQTINGKTDKFTYADLSKVIDFGFSEKVKMKEVDVISVGSSLDEDNFICLSKDVKLCRREVESASSLDKLINYPFDYVMEYCLGIKDKKIADPNNLTNVQGTVYHRFIEKLFKDGDSVRSMQVVKGMVASAQQMEALFEESVDECGMILREPRCVSQYLEVKAQILGNIGVLLDIIEKNRLSVIGVEVKYDDVPFVKYKGEDIKLRGSVDMLLEDSKGGKVIFDFKYSSGTKYLDKLKKNKSVQLAVYKHFLKTADIKAAYIFLKGMSGVSTEDFDFYIQKVVPKDILDMMQYVKDSYIERWSQLDEGKIDCSGDEYEYSKYKHLIK